MKKFSNEEIWSIIGGVTGVIALVGLPYSFLSTISGEQSVDTIYKNVSIFIYLFSIVVFVIVALIVLYLISTLDSLSKTEALLRKTIDELEKLKEDRVEEAGRPAKIAERFTDLSRSMYIYQAAVSSFKEAARNVKNRSEAEKLLNQKWEKISNLWRDANIALCNSASAAISIKRSGNENDCFANIKFVNTVNSVDQYKVLFHSSHTSSDRRSFDDTEPKQVERNRLYREMLTMEDFLIVDDMEAYTRETARHRKFFDEPTERHAELYKSCMLAPIRFFRDDQVKGQLIGIFCIDSPKVGFFNREFDKLIASQTVHNASLCFLVHLEAINIQSYLGNFTDTAPPQDLPLLN